jgi:hypothetical protein
MWTDTTGRDEAAVSIVRQVAADTVEPVRVYVAAPPGAHGGKAAFTMTATDMEGGTVRVETRFDAPGKEGDGQ